jgi:hypothetical protein
VFDDADFLPLVLLGSEGRLDDLPMIVSYLRYTVHLVRARDSVCKLEGSLLDSNRSSWTIEEGVTSSMMTLV